MAVRKLRLGDVEIFALQDGFFHVDGGAMFGVVPRTAWEKTAKPDARNRIRLSLNCYLVKTPGCRILVDTGAGETPGPRMARIYGFESPPALVGQIREAGCSAEDIDLVFNTHLHFDHCGGNVHRNERGEFLPAFPKARYVVQRGEWANGLHPVERDRTSYVPKNLPPLKRHACLELVDGDARIAPGVEAVLTPGHTAHHQSLKVVTGAGTFFFLGDAVPTSAHIALSSIMSYDLYPVETYDTKKKILEQAAREDWIVAFSHDVRHGFGRVRKAGGKYEFLPSDG